MGLRGGSFFQCQLTFTDIQNILMKNGHYFHLPPWSIQWLERYTAVLKILGSIPTEDLKFLTFAETYNFFPFFKNLISNTKNYRLSNTFWSLQHGVRNAQFQCYSYLKWKISIWVTLQNIPGQLSFHLTYSEPKLVQNLLLESFSMFQRFFPRVFAM